MRNWRSFYFWILLICAFGRADAADRQPNVIVLFTDDQGYADLGLHGSKIVKTPNIDSIGRNGIHFTAGYVAAPQFGPSRAGTRPERGRRAHAQGIHRQPQGPQRAGPEQTV